MLPPLPLLLPPLGLGQHPQQLLLARLLARLLLLQQPLPLVQRVGRVVLVPSPPVALPPPLPLALPLPLVLLVLLVLLLVPPLPSPRTSPNWCPP